MVTTRSAEKRLIATGKTEDLAVRPKHERPIPVTPTPSAVKRTNISIDIPRHEDANPDSSEGAEVDDESPYATAKESPGSFLDAESLLSISKSITPHGASTRSSTGSRKRKALFDSERMPSSSSPVPSRVQTFAESVPQQSNLAADLPVVSSEIQPVTSTANQQQQLYPEPTISAMEDSMIPDSHSQNQKAILSMPTLTSTSTSLPGQLFKVPTIQHSHSDRSEASSIRTDSFATNSSRTLVGDILPAGTGTATATGTITYRTLSLPRSLASSGNLKRLNGTKLPDRPRNTLESFRQHVMAARITSHGKRSRGFNVTDDWSAKRRKFVMT